MEGSAAEEVEEGMLRACGFVEATMWRESSGGWRGRQEWRAEKEPQHSVPIELYAHRVHLNSSARPDMHIRSTWPKKLYALHRIDHDELHTRRP